MRRYFGYVPIQGHIILLSLAFVMRLPEWLMPTYALSEASLMHALAEQILMGKALYGDIWHEGAPLLPWLYSCFHFVFGDTAAVWMNISGIIYVYALAAALQGMLNRYRVCNLQSYHIGAILVLLLCLPWYGIWLSPTLLSLLPFLYVLSIIIRLTQGENLRGEAFVGVGAWIGIITLFAFIHWVWVLGVFIIYLLLRTPRASALMASLLGIVGVYLLVILGLYFTDSLGSFIEKGFLGNLQYFGEMNPDWKERMPRQEWIDMGINWGIWLLLGTVGVIHYRLKRFGFVLDVRNIETAMFVWLLFGLVSLLLLGSMRDLHDFLCLAPPLAFYAGKGWDLRKKILWKMLLWVGAILIPLILYLDMLSLVQGTWTLLPPQNRAWLNIDDTHVDAGTYWADKQLPDSADVWVLSTDYYLYSIVGGKPATPFTDMVAAHHYIWDFQQPRNPERTGVPEAEIFTLLKPSLPRYIIDRDTLMPQLQSRFPTLFLPYTPKPQGNWILWTKPVTP